jgi:hypothetical protein
MDALDLQIQVHDLAGQTSALRKHGREPSAPIAIGQRRGFVSVHPA